jgi:hypothetical protein
MAGNEAPIIRERVLSTPCEVSGRADEDGFRDQPIWMGKTHMGRRVEPDIIRRYREWVDHRYDPGYWTGGNLPPWLRRYDYNRRGRRRCGFLFIAWASLDLLAVAAIAARDFRPIESVGGIAVGVLFSAAWPAIFLAAGFKLLRTPGHVDAPSAGRSGARQ